ncbi:MAG: hypothetical protein SGARI_007667 [Bacillariaceae sp.]
MNRERCWALSLPVTFDLFELTLPRTGAQQDAITSFAYTPLISPLAPKTCDDYPEFNKDEAAFQSRTSVVLDTPGLPLKPILSVSKPPPGLSFLKRPRQSKTEADGSGGSSNENAYEDPNEHAKPEPPSGVFGFLQKYWYIVLPMVLMQFMAPPAEEPPQQQGGEAPQEGAAAPPAVAAAPAGGGKKAQRRGKRS